MRLFGAWGFLVFFTSLSHGADIQPSEALVKKESQTHPESDLKLQSFLTKDYLKLASIFDIAVDSFSPDYEALRSLSSKDKEYIANSKFWGEEENVNYVCHCDKMANNRGKGMAALVHGIETSLADAKKPVATVLFLGPSVAVTEFILIDALLLRNPSLVISVDLVDPFYGISTHAAEKIPETARILFDALMNKYPNRIFYSLRNEDFSFLPLKPQALDFLWYEYPLLLENKAMIAGREFQPYARKNYASCFSNEPSSIFQPQVLRQVKLADGLVIALAGFDLEHGSGLKSYRRVKELLSRLNLFEPDSKKLKKLFKERSWKLFTTLVAEGKCEADF